LVWHHDTQGYAGAVYLTPDAPPWAGTSFWRGWTHGCRRRPSHPKEALRLGGLEVVEELEGVVTTPTTSNTTTTGSWWSRWAGLGNRLVIWDTSLIHSATSYTDFSDAGPAPSRLVQLFIFDAG
jgi:hypothetical protein